MGYPWEEAVPLKANKFGLTMYGGGVGEMGGTRDSPTHGFVVWMAGTWGVGPEDGGGAPPPTPGPPGLVQGQLGRGPHRLQLTAPFLPDPGRGDPGFRGMDPGRQEQFHLCAT